MPANAHNFRHANGLALGLLVVLCPHAASAHIGEHLDSGLTSGLMHPVFGLDHLLAMVSVGVVSVQLGGHNIWRIPAAFVAAMIAGGMLGIARIPLPYPEIGIAVSVVVLGMSIVFADMRMSPWPITALVIFFGALHGYAHGVQIPTFASPALYTLGFVLSTATLHLFGVVIGELASLQTWLWKGLRLSGGAVAAVGVAFIIQNL